VFRYVRDVLAEPGLAPGQRDEFADATLRQAPHLLSLDPAATAQVPQLQLRMWIALLR
jgi:hypothetical protein